MKHSKQSSMSRIFIAAFAALALWVLSGARVSRASSSWSYTGPMNVARSSFTATLLNDGRVLVAGGAGTEGRTELYDPAAGTWTAIGTLNLTRYQHTATRLPDGRVLVAGGACLATCNQPGLTAEIYDPASGTWTLTANMNSPHNLHTAVLLTNGKVLVAGGLANGSASRSVEIFDPAAGTWSTTGNLNTARMRHTATILPDGKVLVVGGQNSGGALASAELFNPGNGRWTPTKSMSVPRVWHVAVLLNNGKVLVAGGCGSNSCSSNVHASAELYSPSNGKWSSTGSMTTARHWFPGALLPDGKAIVSGGWDAGYVYLLSAEAYDPASGTWSAIASLNDPRKSHTMTLLPDGRVLATGGVDGVITITSAEIYETLP